MHKRDRGAVAGSVCGGAFWRIQDMLKCGVAITAPEGCKVRDRTSSINVITRSVQLNEQGAPRQEPFNRVRRRQSCSASRTRRNQLHHCVLGVISANENSCVTDLRRTVLVVY